MSLGSAHVVERFVERMYSNRLILRRRVRRRAALGMDRPQPRRIR